VNGQAIGKEKEAQVRSIPPGFILIQIVDDTGYVIAEVLKRADSKETRKKLLKKRLEKTIINKGRSGKKILKKIDLKKKTGKRF